MIPHDSRHTRISESIVRKSIQQPEEDVRYIIVGRYNGRKEDVDCADTPVEAEEMLREYRMAFGSGWSLWIEDRGVVNA